jgi:Cys-rich repeat protein
MFRASLTSASGLWLGLVGFSVLSGCAESDSKSGSCEVSSDCDAFTVCREGACVVVECTVAGQCNLEETCAQAPEGISACTPLECDPVQPDSCPEGELCAAGICVEPCLNQTDCPAGQTCQNSVCVPGSSSEPCQGDACLGKPCTSDAACDTMRCISGQCLPEGSCLTSFNCEAGFICDTATKTCVPEGGDVVGGDDAGGEEGDTSESPCTETGCDDGQVCNETTGECETPIPGEGATCSPCGGDDDCQGGGQCTPLGGSLYCLDECTKNGDCQTGYKCVAIPASGTLCIPSGGTCEKTCIQEGCPSGKVCEFSTGDCVQPLLACDSCTKDDQCGPDARCVLFTAGDRRCMPTCKGGNCPDASNCTEKDGVDVCLPAGTSCCYGDQCGAGSECDNCAADTPYCFQGACVECLNSTHCPGSTCNVATKTCEAASSGECGVCPSDKPFCHPQLQTCVECFNSGQCPEGELCSPESVCAGTDDICQFCADPYPACADIGGQKQCVQCVQDSDCPSGQCDEKTYFCEGSNIPTTGNCTKDADCAVGTAFVLKCDTGSGLCYDVEGRCDNVSAYCNGSTGSECISVFDLLGAGGGAGLPPDLGAFGFCTCNPLADLCNAIPGLCGTTAASKCFGGLQCDLFTSVLSSLLGGATGDPAFNGTSFCGP